MDTGEIIPLTQRERDIDSILRYFYTNCGQEVLDVHSITHTVTEQFPCIIIAMYHFLRKCSEGWTYNIHDMSRKYPKEEIVVNLYQAALHFTYNRALVNYDNHITAQDSKRYAIKPYPFQAPDLQYYEHMPYMTSNGTLHLRTRRHAPSTNIHQQAIAVQQFALSEAVHKMETQEPIYVGPILPASFDA